MLRVVTIDRIPKFAHTIAAPVNRCTDIPLHPQIEIPY
jgi:hypothetical protein